MSRKLTIQKLVLGATLFVFAKGDGAGGCCSHSDVLGPPTEAVCPPTSTLTYVNFGEPFMTKYCIGCHSSTLSGDDRMGAPAFHDFDTQIGIQRVMDHIDETAASGPAATNLAMPPKGESHRPTLEERQQLAEWIACGAP